MLACLFSFRHYNTDSYNFLPAAVNVLMLIKNIGCKTQFSVTNRQLTFSKISKWYLHYSNIVMVVVEI